MINETSDRMDREEKEALETSNKSYEDLEIVSMEILNNLIQRLKNDKDLKTQFDAAETLTKIIHFGTYEQKNMISKSAHLCIHPFINLLSSPAEKNRKQASEALTGLLFSYDTIDEMIRMNITGSVLKLLKIETSVGILRKVSDLLMCICVNASEKYSNANISEIVSALCILMKHSDNDVLYRTVLNFNTLIAKYRYCKEKMQQIVIDSKILVDFIPLLSNKEATSIVLRRTFDIICISDEHTRAVIAQNPLSHFPMLLTHQENSIRAVASWCLSIIIERSPSQVQVAIDLNLMPMVFANLKHEDSEVQIYSARTIAKISERGTEDQIKELFCSDVIIERLFGQLLNCEWRALTYLLEGLNNIVKIYCIEMISLKLLKQIMPIITELIRKNDTDNIITSVVRVMTIFAGGNDEQIQELIDSDIVPILIPFLSHPDADPELLKASLCLIANVVLGSDNQIDFVLNDKLLSIFPKLLSHKYADIVDKSLFILNKINELGRKTKSIIDAGLLELVIEQFKHDEFRIKKKSSLVISNMTLNANKDRVEVLLNAGAFQPFLNMAKCHDAETIHIVLNGMMNIMTTYHNESPMPTEMSEQINLTLQHLIHHADDNILERTNWALSYFLDGGDENIQLVIDSGVLPRLIELLEKLEESIKVATLHILCKIVSYATERQLDLDFNVSSNLSPLLSHPLDEIREVSLTILSHLTFGTQEQADLLVDEVLLSNIIENLMTSKIEIKKLALIIISNLTMHITKKDQIMQLSNAGVFSKFIEMMTCDDTEIVELVLSSITRIMKMSHDHPDSKKNQHLQQVIENDFLSQCIKLLSHSEWKIQLAALCAIYEIGSISTNSQIIIDKKLLSKFHSLLDPALTTNKVVRSNALWFLLRIIKVSQQHCKAVIDAGLTLQVIKNLTENNTDIDRIATLVSYKLKQYEETSKKVKHGSFGLNE